MSRLDEDNAAAAALAHVIRRAAGFRLLRRRAASAETAADRAPPVTVLNSAGTSALSLRRVAAWHGSWFWTICVRHEVIRRPHLGERVEVSNLQDIRDNRFGFSQPTRR